MNKEQKAAHRFVMLRGGYATNEQLCIKMTEELGEIAKALLRKDKRNLKEEIGDLLFNTLLLANKTGIDSRKAVYHSIDKYLRRGDSKMLVGEHNEHTSG